MRELTKDEQALMRIKRSHPFKGGSKYGGGKLTSICPHCGAGPRQYRFAGRSKFCGSCGLENAMEDVFMMMRHAIRRGVETEPHHVLKALRYGNRVYG
jgi:hypothetical protein